VEQNSFAQQLGAKVQFLEAWKQLVEVTVSKCYDHLRHIAGEASLYELLERLLALLNSADTRAPLADIASSVLLFLITKLREQNLPHHLSQDGSSSPPPALSSSAFLDSSFTLVFIHSYLLP